MSEIRIDYYGHSCFKVSNEKGSVLFDPYAKDSVPGINLPDGIEADAVYCSHGHSDHNASDLIGLSGNEAPFEGYVIEIPHDDAEGSLRGMNQMTFLQVGKATIVHMGDIGCEPDEAVYEELKKADVVMIPVGGHYTIDAEMAKKILDVIGHPCLTILMHYRLGERGYDEIADLHDVRNTFPDLKPMLANSVVFDDDKIPDQVMTLEPLQ